jgi:type III pantothenate kinase
MTNEHHSLVIDAGNTRIKVGVFHHSDLKEVHSFDSQHLTDLKVFLQQHDHLPAIIASVKADKDTKWLKQLLPKALLFKTTMPLPLKMGYETPETLGVDRLCNAIAAHHLSRKACLIVDIGTCVKYDLVTADGTYEGGAISPGIELRFRAMHTFTGKLPLIEDKIVPPVIGKNTLDAMRSGVLHGIKNEIAGFAEYYRSQFPELTIFLTGGDANYFDLGLKNDIFADENLTLKGLQLTLAHYDL